MFDANDEISSDNDCVKDGIEGYFDCTDWKMRGDGVNELLTTRNACGDHVHAIRFCHCDHAENVISNSVVVHHNKEF